MKKLIICFFVCFNFPAFCLEDKKEESKNPKVLVVEKENLKEKADKIDVLEEPQIEQITKESLDSVKEETKPTIVSVDKETVKQPQKTSYVDTILSEQEEEKKETKNTNSSSNKIVTPEKKDLDLINNHENLNLREEIYTLQATIAFLGIVIISLLLSLLFYEKRKKNKKMSNEANDKNNNKENIKIEEKNQIKKEFNEKIDEKVKVLKDKKKSPQHNWTIVHTSEIGKSHINAEPPIPCQDNNAISFIESGWGVAVVCDGAGSAKLSQIGSKQVSTDAVSLFKEIVLANDWISKNKLPSEEEWEKVSFKALLKLKYDLGKKAEYSNAKIKITDLACTIIVVIFSPVGLLTTHIGDGRAGYQDKNGLWHAMLTPHNGDESSQTIFITSPNWHSGDFTMSNVKVPESRVIKEKPKAFTLLSDGCDSSCFEINVFDEKTEKYTQPNKPFPGFFNNITKQISSMKKEGLSYTQMQEKWSSFIKGGTKSLSIESDDKTLIVGVLDAD